jgi:hypothetical protein
MQQDIEEGLTTKHKTYIKAVYDRKEEEKKSHLEVSYSISIYYKRGDD